MLSGTGWRISATTDNWVLVVAMQVEIDINFYDDQIRQIFCPLRLSLWFEYLDLTFIVKCLKDPSDHFNILFQYIIQFVSNNTCASSACKFKCTFPRSSIHFFYFNRVVRIWNSLPIINLSLSSSTIKKLIKNFLDELLLTLITQCSRTFCCPCHLCQQFM